MPDARRQAFTVALIATPVSSAGVVFGFRDLLASTRHDWELLHGGTKVASPFRPLVVTRDGQPIVGAYDVRITPDAGFQDCPRPDIVVVTDLRTMPGGNFGQDYGPELEYLRQAWEHGATLCSSCSGAMMLAGTGLLDGCEGTSHWAYCDALSQVYPSTRWRAERALVVTGPDQRLMLGGGGTTWYMLVLAVIARFASPEDAMRVARLYLLSRNDVSAVAYSSLARCPRAAEDTLVARCQVWAASNYRAESPVSKLVELAGLPERTFKRRFTEATGMTPLEYIHTLRLEEAKQLLEATDMPVEAVAIEVGYQDASFFSRLFRRKVQLTPAQYRRRFGELSQQLRRIAETPAGAAAQLSTYPIGGSQPASSRPH